MNENPFDGLHVVPAAQAQIDLLLRNWAEWLRPASGGSGDCAPMWRMTRSSARARDGYGRVSRPAADERQALLVERALPALPPMHTKVLRWYYVDGGSPFRIAKETVGKWHLTGLLRDARQRLNACVEGALAIERAKAPPTQAPSRLTAFM